MYDQINYTEVGKRIVELRLMRDWSMDRLAKEAKITITELQIAEEGNGFGRNSLEVLVGLVNAFGVTVDYLLYGKLHVNQVNMN